MDSIDTKWLGSLIQQQDINVKGALVMDVQNGLSLARYGVASSEDAPFLSRYASQTMASQSIREAAVKYKSYRVLLKSADNKTLVALYTNDL